MRAGLVFAAISAVLTLMAGVAPAAAETWPLRNVRFIVPLGPGSGADIAARLIAERLSARWGKPVVVENRPGGDGIVGITAFVSAHDDHTLLFTPAATFTAHPYLHDKLPYDVADLIPVARVSNTIVAIVTPASSKLESLKDVFAAARERPGKLNWATATGISDFLMAAYLKKAGLDMSKVPYRDPVQPSNDLAEGRIEFYWGAFAIVRPQVQAGKARLVAFSNTMRFSEEPKVPTVAEAGYPELNYDGLLGLFAPRELAADVRERIAGDLMAAAADPVVSARLLTTGQVVSPGNAAEFTAEIDKQRAIVAVIAKELGIKPAAKSQ
jgi:tripartite-type tricarboxylate transporter receptor subunit TctC